MTWLSKKAISFALVFSMFFTMCLPAYAESSDVEESEADTFVYVEPIENGYIYSELNDSQAITILTDEVNKAIEIDIANRSQQSRVYQFILNDVSELNNTDEYWKSLIEFGNSHLDEANIINVNVEEITYDEAEMEIMPLSSARADLLEELQSITGARDYSGKYLQSITRGGPTFKVNENCKLSINKMKTYSWNNNPGLTVGALITGILGLSPVPRLVAAICGVFGVAATVASILPSSAKMDKYDCKVQYLRYVTANGSQYAYATAYKFKDYMGYDNPNNYERAYIDGSSLETTYDASANYFNDYSAMVDDAARMFQQVGQQP